MNIVPITFAFDNNLVLPACICISSLMMNAKKDTIYDIFILHSEKEIINKSNLNNLPTFYPNCKISYRIVDSSFDNAFEIRGITKAAYYRLMIPNLIPEYEKIIYSDVDVIFRLDLTELYNNINMENYYIAGVNNLAHIDKDLLNHYQNNLGLNPKEIICSGFLVMNSKKIIKDDLCNKFLYLSKNKYKFQDQDILNLACKNYILQLPPKFSMLTYTFSTLAKSEKELLTIWTKEQIIEGQKIGNIHYNGQKPWKDFCLNFDLWWEYYRKSPFYDENFYFNFFWNKLEYLDRLSLWKRIKVLARYFINGRKK